MSDASREVSDAEGFAELLDLVGGGASTSASASASASAGQGGRRGTRGARRAGQTRASDGQRQKRLPSAAPSLPWAAPQRGAICLRRTDRTCHPPALPTSRLTSMGPLVPPPLRVAGAAEGGADDDTAAGPSSQVSRLVALPAEVHVHVLKWLSPSELVAASSSCRALRAAAAFPPLWAFAAQRRQWPAVRTREVRMRERPVAAFLQPH